MTSSVTDTIDVAEIASQNIHLDSTLEPELHILQGHERNLTDTQIWDLLVTASSTALPSTLGVAPIYDPNPDKNNTCKLCALALATHTHAIVVKVDHVPEGADNDNFTGPAHGRALLANIFLASDTSVVRTVSFGVKPLAVVLYASLGLRVAQTFDVLAFSPAAGVLPPPTTTTTLRDYIKSIVPEQYDASLQEDLRISDEEEEEEMNADKGDYDTALHNGAWRASLAFRLSCALVKQDKDAIVQAKPHETTGCTEKELDRRARFMERLLQIERETRDKLRRQGDRNGWTRTESLRAGIIESALYDPSVLDDLPIFHALCTDADSYDNAEVFWNGAPELLCAKATCYTPAPGLPALSEAQGAVVARALSTNNADRLLLVHGAPRTGKTTVVAALCAALAPAQPVWVLSRSNTALFASADMLKRSGCLHFKILASKDTIVPDSLRELLALHMLPIDALYAARNQHATISLIENAHVVLCTLRTMESPGLGRLKRLRRVQTVILDEAGVIDVNALLPLVYVHAETLSRLVLLGDEKQTPPSRHGRIRTVRSAFGVPHLQRARLLLDTQFTPACASSLRPSEPVDVINEDRHLQPHALQLVLQVGSELQEDMKFSSYGDKPTAEARLAKLLAFAKVNPSAFNRLPFLRALLEGDNVGLENLWANAPALPNPLSSGPGVMPELDIPDSNETQSAIVTRALSTRDEDRLLLVHGSPGTGKTTTIVTLCEAAAPSHVVWVVTQTNAALRAVVSMLLDAGFDDFKFMAAKSAQEDMSSALRQHLFHPWSPDPAIAEQTVSDALKDTRVMVCTLSMLSRASFHVRQLFPVETVIVDEAGQINFKDILLLVHSNARTLARLVLIGDERQLPPYDSARTGNVTSVFEVPHLQRRRVSLDTQYRMPHSLAAFLAREVYGDSSLVTEHSSTSQIACRFVDVALAELKADTEGPVKYRREPWSRAQWPLDIKAAVKVAKRYTAEDLDFIILVKDASLRDLVAERLKKKKLSPALCSTIANFHGREVDHVIVCLGRRWGTSVLDERLAAVMISRCRTSMVVCSSSTYLGEEAKDTLPARLSQEFCKDGWITWDQLQKDEWPLELGEE